MTRRGKVIGYGIILLWMFGPLIPVFVASVIAAIFGCEFQEAGRVYPCIVFGNDIGEFLSYTSAMAFLGMATFPTGTIALIVFAVIVWWRNRRADRDQRS